MTKVTRRSLNIWLVRDGEPIPTDSDNVRLLRIGLLAKLLAKRGHNVNWITSNWDHHNKRLRCEQDKVISVTPNYQLTLLKTSTYEKNVSLARIAHNRNFAKRLTEYANQHTEPDIIIASHPLIESCAAMVSYAKQHKIPVIVELRDMWPDIMLNLVPKPAIGLAKLLLAPLFRTTQRAFQQADALVGITDDFLKWGLTYANRARRCNDKVFPLAYEVSQFDAATLNEANQFWEKLGVKKSPGQKIIAYAGSLTSTLPLEEAIHYTVNSQENIKLIIAGHKGHLERYKQLANKCDKIVFSGWINKPKIWALLNMADIGLAPYIIRKDFNASTPNKIIEYLAAGLPVLSTIQGTSAKLIRDNQCGLIYKKGELAKAMEQMLHHQDINKFTQNAKATFNAKFNAELIYAKFCDFIESLQASTEHSS